MAKRVSCTRYIAPFSGLRLTTFAVQCIDRPATLFRENACEPVLHVLEDGEVEGLLIPGELGHDLGELDLSIKVDELDIRVHGGRPGARIAFGCEGDTVENARKKLS